MHQDRPTLTQRPTGLFTAILALVATIIGLVTFSPLLLSAGLLAAAVWTTCRYLSAFSLRNLSFERQLPARSVAGESFPVRTIVRNTHSNIAVSDLQFSDPVSDQTVDLFSPITPMGSRETNYPARRNRRGRYGNPNSKPAVRKRRRWTAQTQWPLGLFACEHSGDFEDSREMLVIPKPFLPPGIKRYIENAQNESQLNSFSPPDPSAGFRYLREFRNGDPLKQIHWPTSVRSEKLLIKDPEPPAPRARRFGLLIHSFSPAGQIETPETYELILRIVTGLLFHFRKEGIEVRYLNLPGRVRLLKEPADFTAAIDRLATRTRYPLSTTDSVRNAAVTMSDCDDLFIISDCPLNEWKNEFSNLEGNTALIDSESLTSFSRPTLRTRKHLPLQC